MYSRLSRGTGVIFGLPRRILPFTLPKTTGPYLTGVCFFRYLLNAEQVVT